MMKRVRKTAREPETSFEPQKSQFAPRPFAAQEPKHEAPSTESSDSAVRFGHSIGDIDIFPRPVVQPKLVLGSVGDRREREAEPMQGKSTSGLSDTQTKEEAPPNRTGMPDQLKSGIENLSGMDLSGVRVHYSSPKPAQLNALAYTQGQEIHVAPGQERHLPHEGWHAVQQMQGRVRPTMHLKDGVPVNDDEGLEHEADLMGERAFTSGQELIAHELTHAVQQNVGAVMQSPLPNQQLPQHPAREHPSASVSDRVIQANGGLEAYANKPGRKKLAGPYKGTGKEHAEPQILRQFPEGDLYIQMNAWPCTDIGYDCHQKLKTASLNRTITVVVTGDQGGYSQNHRLAYGSTGTITYTNGAATYS